MQLVLLCRHFALPALGTQGRLARVSLLQDTDTMRKSWEVSVIVRTNKRGTVLGATTRKRTRTDAMRLVRQMLYPTV